MADKRLPFGIEKIREISRLYPTPFHLYDEKGIKDHARRFSRIFGKLNGFQEFFAVKALPNPFILKLLKKQGFGTDCSSLPELLLSEAAGITGESIMFTSNDTPGDEFVKAKDIGAIINLDDISHIEYLERSAGIPKLLCFRYNPGPSMAGNRFIGNPSEAKYGFTRDQLFQGYEIAKRKGVARFGLHTMVVSNDLKEENFIATAAMLFDLVAEISSKIGIAFEFVNLGGGIGIPYRPEDKEVDYEKIAKGIQKEYEQKILAKKLLPLGIFMECGRTITGPFGYLVSSVRHVKHIYKDYVGLDATMANLMRPGMYGAYHHITVLGKENEPCDHVYDVTGSLCENNDKFAIDRKLPKVVPGDMIVIHDTGAHGHAMGFNYNGKLRSAELLLREDGSVIQIRRRETPEDYFSTLDFSGLKRFNYRKGH